MNPLEEKLRDVGVAYWAKVAPGARRSTPAPCLDILKILPDLAARARTAVRLHPRYGPELPVDASKLGGPFLWPAAEPWPVCPEHEQPYLTVLQLRADDVPEMPFPPGTDLFQWLWCGVEHGWTKNAVFWRKASAVGDRLRSMPVPSVAEERYVPVPCGLHPERVTEYPSFAALTAEQQGRIRAWTLPDLPDRPWLSEMGPGAAEDLYRSELAVCPGTKVGGYPDDFGAAPPPVPSAGGRPLEYLLTLSADEFGGRQWPRWEPVEDRPFAKEKEHPPRFERFSQGIGWRQQVIAAAQLFGGEGRIHLYVDRASPGWPVVDRPSSE